MSVSVEIFRVPELSEKEVPVMGLWDSDIPFLDDDFLQESLDLNAYVSGNINTTFYAKVKENGSGSKYHSGDVLVVDRSWPLQNNKFAVCYIGNDFVVKMIKSRVGGLCLESLNGSEDPIILTEENRFLVWGMVTYVIRKMW